MDMTSSRVKLWPSENSIVVAVTASELFKAKNVLQRFSEKINDSQKCLLTYPMISNQAAFPLMSKKNRENPFLCENRRVITFSDAFLNGDF
jgi:hypothetical protein